MIRGARERRVYLEVEMMGDKDESDRLEAYPTGGGTNGSGGKVCRLRGKLILANICGR